MFHKKRYIKDNNGRGIVIPIGYLDIIFLILAVTFVGLAQSEIKPEHIVTKLPDGPGDGKPQNDDLKCVVVSVTEYGVFFNDKPIKPEELLTKIPAGAVVELRGEVESEKDVYQRIISVMSVVKQTDASQFSFAVNPVEKKRK